MNRKSAFFFLGILSISLLSTNTTYPAGYSISIPESFTLNIRIPNHTLFALACLGGTAAGWALLHNGANTMLNEQQKKGGESTQNLNMTGLLQGMLGLTLVITNLALIKYSPLLFDSSSPC